MVKNATKIYWDISKNMLFSVICIKFRTRFYKTGESLICLASQTKNNRPIDQDKFLLIASLVGFTGANIFLCINFISFM